MQIGTLVAAACALLQAGLCLSETMATTSFLTPSGYSESASTPALPPSQDPWYTAPDGFESTTPGTILRLRIAPSNLTSIVKKTAAAWNILYRTTDSHYQPSFAVTTLFIPKDILLTPSGKKAVVSYQFAYDSADLSSSPSYGFYNYLGEANVQLGIPASTDLITQLLEKGYIVNSPDYEGPKAAFGASVQAGHATLDALRAVVNLSNLSGFGDLSIVMWGYSGGSIATEAAAEMQAEYAPQLSISAAVVGGLVDDIAADYDLFNETPIAGDLVAAILGLAAQYPEAYNYVCSRLKPKTAEEFLAAKNMTLIAATQFYANKNIYDYFIGGGADLQVPILQKVYYKECRLGNYGLPEIPMYVYKAIADEYCPINRTDALVNRFCAAGVPITYERNTAGGHVAEIGNAKAGVFKWIKSIFDGTYKTPAGGCSIRDVTKNSTGESG
ncbi:LIP-domain-containing protein [Xylariaceae sp. FL0255]|nr:LIP-domain-containing protein [Xylariaceae sp. FL0255]